MILHYMRNILWGSRSPIERMRRITCSFCEIEFRVFLILTYFTFPDGFITFGYARLPMSDSTSKTGSIIVKHWRILNMNWWRIWKMVRWKMVSLCAMFLLHVWRSIPVDVVCIVIQSRHERLCSLWRCDASNGYYERCRWLNCRLESLTKFILFE